MHGQDQHGISFLEYVWWSYTTIVHIGVGAQVPTLSSLSSVNAFILVLLIWEFILKIKVLCYNIMYIIILEKSALWNIVQDVPESISKCRSPVGQSYLGVSHVDNSNTPPSWCVIASVKVSATHSSNCLINTAMNLIQYSLCLLLWRALAVKSILYTYFSINRLNLICTGGCYDDR